VGSRPRPYVDRPGDEHELDLADEELIDRGLKAVKVAERYFRYELCGLDNVPSESGALIISPHSASAIEGFLLGLKIYQRDGRIPRGLTDHTVFKIPWMRDLTLRFGIVDGNRDNAVQLLERGELCFAMPGGGDEAFKSSAHRYELRWQGHDGFVRVALRAGAPIIPTVCIGADDIYWLPVDGMRAGRRLFGARFPLLLGFGIGPLPLPVKLTAYVGEPIEFDERGAAAADDEQVVARCHARVVDIVEGMLSDGLARRRSLWL